MSGESLAAAEVPEVSGVHETPLLEVFGVVKRFKKLTVLDGIDLDLEPSSLVAITGRNGVGKTTLLRVAGGLIFPDAGTVSLQGCTPKAGRKTFFSRLGYLSAGDRGLYARLNVRRQLELWSKLAMVPGSRRPQAVEAALETFELADLALSRVDRISMGQRQRVRLAMTFLHDPDVVLLDEPLTSLDAPAASLLYDAIGELRSRGGAVLWCAPALDGTTLEFDRAHEIIEGKLVDA